LILQLAMRNLVRNLRNSIIILILIMVIITLFFIGNSVILGSERKLRESYTGSFTGDIVIKALSETSISLFGSNTPAIGEFISIPVLEHYNEIILILEQDERIELLSSQVSGIAVLDIYGRRYNVPLFGIDADSYFPLFNEIEIEEGSMLVPGQRGAMISKNRALQIEKETGRKPVPGTPLLFSTLGQSGFKIRELILSGIYTYKNSTPVMDEIILTDPQTLRALNSIMLASDSDFDPSEETTDLLGDNIDFLFEKETSFDQNVEQGNISLLDELTKQFSTEEIDSSDKIDSHWKGGSWNFILLKLKKGVSAKGLIKDLNIQFSSYSAEAGDWRQAAGKSALLVMLLLNAFNGGVFLVGIVGIIAVTNILLISVFRRTREIGTMRAIGASSSYIISLILIENTLLSFTSGLLGTVSGTIIINALNKTYLPVSNQLLRNMLGQGYLHIHITADLILLSLALSVFLGIISSIYPVYLSLKIEPSAALRKG